MNDLVRLPNDSNPIITSVCAETFEDKKRIYNAVNAPTGDINDIVNNDVEICDYHMSYEQKVDEEGFVYDRIKTTILLTDGRSYSTTYKSFAKSLMQLMSIFGVPDVWTDHKLTVRVRTVKYQGGLHDGLSIDVV